MRPSCSPPAALRLTDWRRAPERDPSDAALRCCSGVRFDATARPMQAARVQVRCEFTFLERPRGPKGLRAGGEVRQQVESSVFRGPRLRRPLRWGMETSIVTCPLSFCG